MFRKPLIANSSGNAAGSICLACLTDNGSMRSRHMLSATCHLLHCGIAPHVLRLLPIATSALEDKMVHTDPNLRFSEQMEHRVLYFVVLAKTHGKRCCIQNGNKSTKSTTYRSSSGFALKPDRSVSLSGIPTTSWILFFITGCSIVTCW